MRYLGSILATQLVCDCLPPQKTILYTLTSTYLVYIMMSITL